MKQGWKKTGITFKDPRQVEPVKIIHDALIASRPVGDGRSIPLIIVDAETRADLTLVVEAHALMQGGDVRSQWGKRSRSDDIVTLFLWFERPIECTVLVDFDVVTQGILVDQILFAKALYLQPGKRGDRLINNVDAPRILIEIPDLGFSKEWEKILRKGLATHFRKEGFRRSQAVDAAERVIAEWRRLSRFRLGV
jgi:hypothetical protein